MTLFPSSGRVFTAGSQQYSSGGDYGLQHC